jgi:hypothetical protein
MRIAWLMAAILWGPLVLAATATVTPERGSSSGAAVDPTETPGHTKAQVSGARESVRGRTLPDRPRAGALQRGSVTMQRGGGQASRGNGDRLRSLLSAQAQVRPVRQPIRRPIGPDRAGATDRGTPVRGSLGATLMRQPLLPVLNPAARAAASPRPLTGGPAMGGRHAAGSGMLGGPASSPTARATGIDGTQLHHKF